MSFRSLVKRFIPTSLFGVVEPYGHLAEAVLQNVVRGFPARGLNVIGVTGTDGKTSTSLLIYRMLQESGLKVAVLTTVSVDFADGRGLRPSPARMHMTTASTGQLLGMLKEIRRNQPDWVVLETSSHALAQHRVWGVPFSVAVMTNVTHEHLDYHKTFKRYVEAKVRLFRQANGNRQGLRAGIINAEDPSAALFAAAIAHPVQYGLEQAEVRAEKLQINQKDVRYTAVAGNDRYQIRCQLPGRFNVYNSLAAVCVGRAVGLSPKQIEQGIAALDQVPGRMMRVEAGQDFEVLVDYAVTQTALESVLKAAREMAGGKVGIVFGATGDRDKTKRPEMGRTVATLADRIYLTDDETYTEDADSIRQAVYAGVKAAGGAGKCQVFDDRRKAIEQAAREAGKGDIILITGLGHQHDRNMGGKRLHWDDAEVAKEVILTLMH